MKFRLPKLTLVGEAAFLGFFMIFVGLGFSQELLFYLGSILVVPLAIVFWLKRRKKAIAQRRKHGAFRRVAGTVGELLIMPREARWAADPSGLVDTVKQAGESFKSLSGENQKTFVEETFEDAMQRFGRTDAHVEQIGKLLLMRGRVATVGIYISLTVGAATLITQNWLWLGTALISAEMLLMLAGTSFFRAYQCRERRFMKFGEYFRARFWRDMNVLEW